jgi:hypothetical protein
MTWVIWRQYRIQAATAAAFAAVGTVDLTDSPEQASQGQAQGTATAAGGRDQGRQPVGRCGQHPGRCGKRFGHL